MKKQKKIATNLCHNWPWVTWTKWNSVVVNVVSIVFFVWTYVPIAAYPNYENYTAVVLIGQWSPVFDYALASFVSTLLRFLKK